eukprot:scaffold1019_cov97-Skeletonema_marinoi.AAC.19
MAFGQRNAAAAKKKSPLKIVLDIESSGGELTIDNDDQKYLKQQTSTRSNQQTLVLFVMALALGFLLDRSYTAFTATTANNVTKYANGAAVRRSNNKANKQLQEQNKYGFTINVDELPNDWVEWGFTKIRRKFKCDQYVNNEIKPLPSMEYWQMILDAYNEQVDKSYKFDELVPPTQGYRFNEAGAQPYYAKVSDGKDRGLFASRDIRKGEVVHDGTKSDVVFPDALAWRRFVFALPRKAACDMTEWSWTQRLENDGPMKLLTAINISVLMNMGLTPAQINAVPKSSTSSLFYATQDIKKGEEILTDYEIYDTRFDLAGLGG